MPKFRCVSCWGPSPARRVKDEHMKTHMEAKAVNGSWVLVKWRTDWCLPCPLCHSDFIHKRLRMHFSGKKHLQSMAEMPDDRRRELRRKGAEKLCRIIKGVPCPGVLPRGQLVRDDDDVALSDDEVESLDDALDDDDEGRRRKDSRETPDFLQYTEERGEPRFR